MKRLFLAGTALIALALTSMAQTPAPAKPTPSPKAKPAVAKTSAPKPDADIQKCIEGKLAGSKLKDDGLTVAVSGGTATFTGTTKIAGHKGNATQFAKACGATKVTNNITVESTPKTTTKKP